MQKHYKINQAVKKLGLTPRTLRFYEHEGLLPDVRRTEGGMRLYSDADLESIREIRRLQKEAMLPLFMIKKRFAEKDKIISASQTKEKIHIVTDSSADIPIEIVEKNGLEILPFKLSWRKKLFRDNIDLTSAELAELSEKKEAPPKIIIPSVEEIASFYQKLINLGAEKIISIHSSSKFNGLILNAQKAAQKIKTAKIKIIDSNSFSFGTGFLAVKSAQLLKEGLSFEEIGKSLEDLIKRIRLLVFCDDLKFLLNYLPSEYQKNIFEKALDFKTLFSLENGEEELGLKRIFGEKETQKSILEQIIPRTKKERNLIQELGIVYCYLYGESLDLINKIRASFPRVNLITNEGSIVNSSFLGPKYLIVVYLYK